MPVYARTVKFIPTFHLHVHITDTLTGLTSSLDSLLKTTPQAKLSECNPIPINQAEDIDAKPSEPITGQTSTTSVSAAPASTASHGQVSRDEFTQVSASTRHTRSTDKSMSTAPCDSETPTTAEDSQMHDSPMISASADTSSEPAYKAMIHCHDKLVTALSSDITTMSGILLAKEFIPAELSSKMLLPNFTPQEKATILINVVTDK